ncbi:MAG: flagellar hook-length control protein FliK [Clostridia bacterium]|jgi:flagellar hook-length control protein FliK|nr:flagellar hook-length control protein FliK [Clostridia bacterium]MCI1999858.1 flagellar hook-length control protein FliK [Clostridia bacterium]MCI2014226.1 flagellar hook-length control protein FliK [Clostridia bacterium]
MNVSAVQSNDINTKTAKVSTAKSDTDGSTKFKDLIKSKTTKKTENNDKTSINKKQKKTASAKDDSTKENNKTSKSEAAGMDLNNVCSFIEVLSKNGEVYSFSQGAVMANSGSNNGDLKTNALSNTANATALSNAMASANAATSNVVVSANAATANTASTNVTTANAQNNINTLVKSAKEVKTETSEGKGSSIKNVTTAGTKISESKEETLVEPKNAESSNTSLSSSDNKTSSIGDKKLNSKTNLTEKNNLSNDKSSNVEVSKPLTFKQNEGFITIKVGEPVTTNTWKSVSQEIGKAIVESVKNGKIEKLNITLNPKELGKINVEFSVDDKKVLVTLICSDNNTKTLLSDNMSALSKIVQSNLGHETVVNVYSEQSSGQEKTSENFDGGGNNGHYRDDSQQNGKRRKESDSDFIQKLRLGILDMDDVRV